MAFVVIVHLSAEHDSALSEILEGNGHARRKGQ